MFIRQINIPEKEIKLIAPDLSHAKISLTWVSGDKGRLLLQKMGNKLSDDWVATIEEEEARIKDFIEKDDQINWAIEYKNKIVGAVWLDLRPGQLIGPHIMIGDEMLYGMGIATNVLRAVCDWALRHKQGSLQRYNFDTLTTRCRVDNAPIIRVNEKLGFKPTGDIYEEDGYTWCNYLIRK